MVTPRIVLVDDHALCRTGLTDLLQRAELVVSDVPWLWGGRDRLRQVVGGFLNPVVG